MRMITEKPSALHNVLLLLCCVCSCTVHSCDTCVILRTLSDVSVTAGRMDTLSLSLVVEAFW